MAADAIPVDVVRSTGPLLLGYLFNWSLFGVLGVQMYMYYLAFPSDRLFPKTVVYLVFVLEAVQTILLTRDAFRVFGYFFGNMEVLDSQGWVWFSVPIMSGFIACIVQLFFAWRIFVLSGRWYIPGIIILISVVGLGAAIWVGVLAHISDHFKGIQNLVYRQYSVWLGSAALADTMITTSMIYYLSRSRTGFRATNSVIAKFMRLTVETGMICAAVALVEVSLFVALRNNSYYMAPARALSKLYSNSLLALLNARFRIVGGRSTGEAPADGTLSYLSFNDMPTTSTATSSSMRSFAHRVGESPHPALNIRVDQDVVTDGILLHESVKFPQDIHVRHPDEEIKVVDE